MTASKPLPTSLVQYGSCLVASTCLFIPTQGFAEQDVFSISGFGRIVAGTIDTDQAEFIGYDDDISLRPNSLFGLQLDAQATDSLSFTAQGVLRASEDVDSELKRLYATYQPESNFAVRVGRVRVPFFMHSDVIDLGYAYHWVSLPHQMYNAFLFPTFDGVDTTWGYSQDDYDVSFEAYLGHHKDTMNVNNRSTDYDIEVLGGLIASVKRGNVELRASYHQGDVDVDVPELDMLSGLISSLGNYSATTSALSTESKVQVAQFGIRYDDFDYFAALEWVLVKPETNTFMAEIDTYYVTGGYIFDPVTVHLTYAKSHLSYDNFPTELNQALAGMSPTDPRYMGLAQSVYALNAISSGRITDNLDSWTIGARWDVQPKLALKADVTFLMGDDNETAMFTDIKDGFDRNARLYQVALEWIF